ncbi:SMI1/KNR4 family protein [Leptospira sp. GIMC2001]|uniref:SMI1/KNR4 family protein n=1 Tax=Leptospira sp. GIMC2001 TaxID=1513297 RepID=UPI00234B65EA|nr:SMI1/KNR4 family protein [Leptospira sp. GIMC2001]WCL50635.1 SMI1/KNR4 family protein [Leptospira sp. GIMC2001]
MNSTVDKYISGLKASYINNNAEEAWQRFEKIKLGAKIKDIKKINKIYPGIPSSLIDILSFVDGTYYREYAGEEITFYFLGSDVLEYPYYLLSCEQIIKNQNIAIEYYSEYIEREYEEVEIDDRITNKLKSLKWLHFSDCMNNGGTSQLFIDFSPSPKGKYGQVVRFLHDPDELIVIADSFEDYLNYLIDTSYNFIQEDLF